MRKNLLPGIVLILAGLYLLIDQFFPLTYGFGVAFIGLALISVRAVRGPRGFTIAGCIVLFAGLAMALADLELLSGDLTATAVVGLLAISFFLMHILDYQRLGHWPIIPGLCLLGVAALVYFYGYDRLPKTFWGWVQQFWPVALICSGAATLGGVMNSAHRRNRRRSNNQDEYNGRQATGYPPPEQNRQAESNGRQGDNTRQYPPPGGDAWQPPVQPETTAQPGPRHGSSAQDWAQSDGAPLEPPALFTRDGMPQEATGQPYGGSIEVKKTAEEKSEAEAKPESGEDIPIILGAPPAPPSGEEDQE